LKLEEMEASDMLDVLHYFFEDDVKTISTGEQAESIDAMRTQLYQLYGQTYRYGAKKRGSTSNGGRSYVTGDYEFPPDMPLDPSAQGVKPFVPATEFNPESSMPFGGVLDAPLA
jgi:hypothetical protein